MTTGLERRAAALRDRIAELSAQGVRRIQIETPDTNGTLRGKLMRLEKGLSPTGGAFCTILYGLSYVDDVMESRFSSFANGFPDATVLADPDTVCILDAEAGIASVICDIHETGGGGLDYVLSPRGALHRAVAKAEAMGFEARFAVELELCALRTDEALIASGGHYDQRPMGRLNNAYSLARMTELRSLASGFMAWADGMGLPIDAIHTELGQGMMEIALGHLPALAAADACARVRLYLKEYMERHGYAAVFMPKWRFSESGCGGHVHQSLWRAGQPAFADEGGALSDLARRYVAGQLATLADFAAVFYPTINAYRRMDAASWAPENVSWGMDNRTCALRAITQPSPASFRIEHRCPGADINPYLAIAAMLAGGLHRVEAGLDAPPPVGGNAADVPGLERLPTSLAAATERFAASPLAGELLGEGLQEQYAVTRRAECALWEAWQREQVSPWEVTRYFDLH